jgi:Fe-S-cluster containining protein
VTEFKNCGPCRACCVVPSIEELGKPKFTPCKHLNEKKSSRNACTIYEDRPGTCSRYQCYYTQSGLPTKYRPDKCGVIIEPQDNPITETRVFVFQEVYPGAANKKLMDQAARKLSAELPVVIRKPDGNMKWILGINHKYLSEKLRRIAVETQSESRVQIVLA